MKSAIWIDTKFLAKTVAVFMRKAITGVQNEDVFNSFWQIASLLKDVDVNAIFDRVEDAVVQADEVDGKILQFEGGLAVTSNIISGAYKLAGHGKVGSFKLLLELIIIAVKESFT